MAQQRHVIASASPVKLGLGTQSLISWFGDSFGQFSYRSVPLFQFNCPTQQQRAARSMNSKEVRPVLSVSFLEGHRLLQKESVLSSSSVFPFIQNKTKMNNNNNKNLLCFLSSVSESLPYKSYLMDDKEQ